MLVIVKMLLGIAVDDTSKDDVLNHFIGLALKMALSYCNITDISSEYNGAVAELAVYLYKNKDSTGYKQKTEGERSVTYIDGAIPEYIKSALPLPKIKVGGA
ncbi:MAG: phage head-tail connector protein [Eubacteriales bacterium]|nr:phage head-tail connector protein [Eubacteriales bacterium]